MNDDNREIHVGDRVELRPGMEDVYKNAVAGSQAIVVGERTDEYEFQRIKVEWDKDHWRYNGEEDGWTYKDHFRPLQNNGLFVAKEDPEKFAAKLVERAKSMGAGEEEIDTFIDKLNEIISLLSESEGFIILTARLEDSPTQSDDKVLIPYTYGGFLSKRSMMLLETQLITMAASAHQEQANRIMKRYEQEGEDEPGYDV